MNTIAVIPQLHTQQRWPGCKRNQKNTPPAKKYSRAQHTSTKKAQTHTHTTTTDHNTIAVTLSVLEFFASLTVLPTTSGLGLALALTGLPWRLESLSFDVSNWGLEFFSSSKTLCVLRYGYIKLEDDT